LRKTQHPFLIKAPKKLGSQMPIAHIYNPSYSGGRDQENHSSKAAWANSLRDPISKTPNPKWAGTVAQGVGPEFKLQY
jgi:hypothetical protein